MEIKTKWRWGFYFLSGFRDFSTGLIKSLIISLGTVTERWYCSIFSLDRFSEVHLICDRRMPTSVKSSEKLCNLAVICYMEITVEGPEILRFFLFTIRFSTSMNSFFDQLSLASGY